VVVCFTYDLTIIGKPSIILLVKVEAPSHSENVTQVIGVVNPKTLTLPEVATLLRMSVHTLRQSREWLSRLGAVKVAGKWLVASDAVHDVLTGRR